MTVSDFQKPSPLAGEGQLAQQAGRGAVTIEVLLERAKWMRRNPTEAERRLWSILRAKRLSGYKFKRQQRLDFYIVDFVSFEHRLIVEADGSQHAESADDAERGARLRSQGFSILRFWNTDILARSDMVADAIWQSLQAAPPLPAASRRSLSREGRGTSSLEHNLA